MIDVNQLRGHLIRMLRGDKEVRDILEGKGNQIAKVTGLDPLQVRIFGEPTSTKVQWVADGYSPAIGDDVEVSRVRGEFAVQGKRTAVTS